MDTFKDRGVSHIAGGFFGDWRLVLAAWIYQECGVVATFFIICMAINKASSPFKKENLSYNSQGKL